MTLRAAVFASGRGSNFQVLAEHPSSHWEVALLVTNRPDAGALDRAERLEIESLVVDAGPESGPALLEALRDASIDIILLAGYLRLLPTEVVGYYEGRMLNLHPALLPSFGGKGMYGHHVHAAVLAAGALVTGVTIHFVDGRYDEGKILAQWPVPVFPDDTPETLAERIHGVEHRLYPAAVDRLVAGLEHDTEPISIPLSTRSREGHFELVEPDPEGSPEAYSHAPRTIRQAERTVPRDLNTSGRSDRSDHSDPSDTRSRSPSRAPERTDDDSRSGSMT